MANATVHDPQPGSTIAVWFSCGAASAVAAKLTIDKYGDCCNVRIINNPVAEEDPDNRRFLADVERWLGVEIEIAINPKYPNASAVEVWERRKFMAGIAGAPCTGYLKKRARQHWEQHNHHDWIVLGFTAQERDRHDGAAQRQLHRLSQGHQPHLLEPDPPRIPPAVCRTRRAIPAIGSKADTLSGRTDFS